jgi:hypothetical protein
MGCWCWGSLATATGVASNGVFCLFYTSRVLLKGHVSMEEMVFSLKHYWGTVDHEPLELYGLSQHPTQKTT